MTTGFTIGWLRQKAGSRRQKAGSRKQKGEGRRENAGGKKYFVNYVQFLTMAEALEALFVFHMACMTLP